MKGKLFFSFDLLVLLDLLFLFMCEPVHRLFVYVVDLFVTPFCFNRFTVFRQTSIMRGKLFIFSCFVTLFLFMFELCVIKVMYW